MSDKEHEDRRAQLARSLAGLNIVAPAQDAPVDDDPEFWLWPENVRTWLAFLGCSTQWRVSMDGREGLDYAGVDHVLRHIGLRPQRRAQAWRDIQAMEFAALRVWADRKREA